MTTLIPIEDALDQLDALIRPIRTTETVGLAEAQNRILARSIRSPMNVPPFNCSAMDGYAIATDDLARRVYSVVGESTAGHPFFEQLVDGQAIRILTGAEVPNGCAAVLLQENVSKNHDTIVLDKNEEIISGQNIRLMGSDFEKGRLLLEPGIRLSPFHIGWLAQCGTIDVDVKCRLRVVLFTTGDELRPAGATLAPGQIYDSNQSTLSALLRSQPVDLIVVETLKDDPEMIEERLTTYASQADLVLTAGGVSVGDADYVRPVIEKIGELAFWNIALKPGKPIAVGKIGEAILMGLPGNPVSAVITYLLFGARAISRLLGEEISPRLRFRARLLSEIKHSRGRREYQRGRFVSTPEGLEVEPLGDQGSHRMSSFAHTNCLIVVPEDATGIPIGDEIEILVLSGNPAHVL